MGWVLAVIAMALGAVFFLWSGSRRRQPVDGFDRIHSFRQHMDALSPEARQHVKARLHDVDRREGVRQHGP